MEQTLLSCSESDECSVAIHISVCEYALVRDRERWCWNWGYAGTGARIGHVYVPGRLWTTPMLLHSARVARDIRCGLLGGMVCWGCPRSHCWWRWSIAQAPSQYVVRFHVGNETGDPAQLFRDKIPLIRRQASADQEGLGVTEKITILAHLYETTVFTQGKRARKRNFTLKTNKTTRIIQAHPKFPRCCFRWVDSTCLNPNISAWWVKWL